MSPECRNLSLRPGDGERSKDGQTAASDGFPAGGNRYRRTKRGINALFSALRAVGAYVCFCGLNSLPWSLDVKMLLADAISKSIQPISR